MADDLGYGDVHCLAPETGKIQTPHADKLSSEGMIFTDAHSGSSVCTPTRYGIMTGRYSWRTRLQRGVVTGFAPNLIDKNRPTVASFLKDQGYHTAIIGKWHLNFQYLDPESGEVYSKKDHKIPPLGARIPDGPLTRGFDYFHGFHHARNMKAVIENEEVIEYDDEINMLPRLTKMSVAYIKSRAGKKEPFFLYLPLGSPHAPILPSPEWQGKSGLGSYGDFVMQTDHALGEVVAALEKHGMTESTLIIFTSDNGCSKVAGIPDLAKQGHLVSAQFRGSKADLWDGGHRIPFIVKWPGKVQAASTSNQLICLTDLFATVGEIAQAELPGNSCEDSVSFLPALSGKKIVSTRNGVIHHSISGHFAYRVGKWKLLLARGSGGWTSPKEAQTPAGSPEAQLYDMEVDAGEETNLYLEKPKIAKRLLRLLEEDVARGRSTAGLESENDVPRIVLWKNSPSKQPDSDLTAKENIVPDKTLTYKKIGEIDLTLHVFYPEDHKPTDKRPGIVFFFGGGWVGGNQRHFYQQAEAFAALGFVAMSADYRVIRKHNTTPFECVKDGKSAVRWVRKHAAELGVDPHRIVAAGGSAGGHVAACTGVIQGYEEEGEDLEVSSVPNAMILYNPVIDTTEKGYGLNKVGQERKTEISPCHHVRKGIVPTLIFHGTDDTTVPFENVVRFTNLMEDAGNSCTLVPFENKKHGFFNGSLFRPTNTDEDFNITMDKSIEFLTAHGYLQKK